MTLEKTLKYSIYVGLAILLYLPFIVSNSLFFPYITGKAYTFRIVTELIVAIWLVLATFYPVYRPRKSWLLYAFGAFLISLFVSNLTGINPEASFWSNFERMEGWVTIAHLFALFVALGSVLREKKEWVWLFNASIVAGLFMVISALAQIFSDGFNTRVSTTLGNSTYLAVYMMFNAFLALFLLFRQKIDYKRWPFWFYSIAFLLQTVILFQTATRGAILGILGGLALMALLMVFLNKGGEGNKMFRRVSISILAAVVVFVSVIFIFKDSALVQNIQPLKRITTISINEGTAQARIINWQIATEGFKERPLLGWGQSNFNYVFDKNYLPEHHGNEPWFDRVHNIFFDWLIAGGIFGLFFYLSIWAVLVWLLFRSQNLSGNEKSVLIALSAGYFFHNLFVFDQIVSYVYFVFILAFVYSQTSTPFSAMQKELPERTRTIILIFILILLPTTLYAVNYPSYKANKELISAITLTRPTGNGGLEYNHENGLWGNMEYFQKAIQRYTFGTSEIRQRAILMFNDISRISNIDEAAQNEYVNFAATEMQQQIEEHPNDSRFPYLLGTFYAQIGRFEQAEKYLLKAKELSPNKKAIRLPLIKVYTADEQPEKALELAKETYELDKSKDDLWMEYINVATTFDKELSSELLSEAIEQGQALRVEELLMRNISANPQNLQNRISLAAFYFQIDKVDLALETLDQAIEDFPDAEDKIQDLKDRIEAGKDLVGQSF